MTQDVLQALQSARTRDLAAPASRPLAPASTTPSRPQTRRTLAQA